MRVFLLTAILNVVVTSQIEEAEISWVNKEIFLNTWNFFNDKNLNGALKVLLNEETVNNCRAIFLIAQFYGNFSNISESCINDEIAEETEKIIAKNSENGAISLISSCEKRFDYYYDMMRSKAYLFKKYMVKSDVTCRYRQLESFKGCKISEKSIESNDFKSMVQLLKENPDKVFKISTIQDTLVFTPENKEKLIILNELLGCYYFKSFFFWLHRLEHVTERISILESLHRPEVLKALNSEKLISFCNNRGLLLSSIGNKDSVDTFEGTEDEKLAFEIREYMNTNAFFSFNHFNYTMVYLQETRGRSITKLLSLIGHDDSNAEF